MIERRISPRDVEALAKAVEGAVEPTRFVLEPGDYPLVRPLFVKGEVEIVGTLDKTRLVGMRSSLLLADGGSTLTLRNLIFENGEGKEGGAVLAAPKSKLKIDLCTFRRNKAADVGGALALSSEEAEVTRSIFEENSAGEGGGALFIAQSGALTFDRCIFRGNRARVGGGIWVRAGGALKLVHCSLYENEASHPKGGGALFLMGSKGDDANVVVINSVIAGREAIYADTSKSMSLGIRGSVLPDPATMVADPRVREVAANVRGVPRFVPVRSGVHALAADSVGAGAADAARTTPGAVDFFGRPLVRDGRADPGAVARPPN